MKLYYTPHTCSFAPHIVLRELGIDAELRRVRIGPEPVVVADGRDFRELSPLGYVPLLQLDDGRILHEGVAILQYLADQHPDSDLAPAPGSFERIELQQWLTFISSELHKLFSPWLFHPEYGDAPGAVARERLQPRLAYIDRHLAQNAYVLGKTFSIADAYLYTIAGWARALKMDLHPYPALDAYLDRIGQRDSVRDALRREREDARVKPEPASA
ncbi:glutathione transferase GstA [Lysobacter capsici]|uniref:glutathione transferase GstA n=1 Tax=Lysobacter capsici TaxID=435897 RepID=UPI000BBB56AE|nr:glutathione transferase GstA [Lysobacter capsici]ATE70348.1 glutathione transferase GstA [Lysobacter capsici]